MALYKFRIIISYFVLLLKLLQLLSNLKITNKLPSRQEKTIYEKSAKSVKRKLIPFTTFETLYIYNPSGSTGRLILSDFNGPTPVYQQSQ